MNTAPVRALAIGALMLFLAGSADASWVPERRKPQFQTVFGYALFPYPYSLPGIGMGLGIVGGAMNINDTPVDAYGMVFGGDVTGLAAGVADIHIIPQNLILDLGYSGLSAATIQSYSNRGMTTNKNDFANVEMGDMIYYGSRLTATFFDRQFEFYGAYYQGSSQLKSIRDRNGNVLVEAQNAQVQRGHVTLFGVRFDLTDDYYDPRRGFRLDVNRTITPQMVNGPDFFVQDYNASAYVPVFTRSTLVLNVLKSDAQVEHMGVTDEKTIREINGLNQDCTAILNPVQRALCEKNIDDFVNNTIAHNTYGTATALGGFSRLRSYPTSRFKGAHTFFYGTEFRWNLTDESTPYDIFVMRDVRTSWQLAFFYEAGTTADLRSQLGDLWRASGGIGLRMITASGVVFRADVATGREGISPSIFIGYPWEL